MTKEQVLVFDSDKLNKAKDIHGVIMSNNSIHRTYDLIFDSRFVDRELAEQDESIKQIIPYVFISNKNKILAYKRTKSSGEGRLHDKWSIGFGGHINTEDASRLTNYAQSLNNMITVSNAIERELKEELDWKGSNYTAIVNQIGILYDDSDSVGRVHFGIIYNIDITDSFDGPFAKENTVSDMQWLTVSDILKLPNLENWSKMIANELTHMPRYA